MNLLQKLFQGRSKKTAQQLQDEAVQRIIDEVRRGTLYTQWDAVVNRITANRLFTRKGGTEEFLQVREFQMGDNPRFIDGRRTFATGCEQIFVREYLPEIKEVWWVVFDGSPTHDFAGLRQSKLDVCARAAATVCMCAQAMDELVGCIVYSGDQVVWFCPPSDPSVVMKDIVRTVLNPSYADGDPDDGLVKALEYLPTDEPSNLIWLTDCLNLKQKGLDALSALSKLEGTHKVVVPQDHREQYLPEPSWRSFWIWQRIKVVELGSHETHYLRCSPAACRRYTSEWRHHTGWTKGELKQRSMDCAIIQTEHNTGLRIKDPAKLEAALQEQRMQAEEEMLALFSSP